MGRKKYTTDEERKEARKVSWRKYYTKHKEEKIARVKQYNNEHKEEKAKYMEKYFAEHKAEKNTYDKQYRINKKEKILEQIKKYRLTPMGRAVRLASDYRRNDKEHNRGECTLTAQWIVDNIFSKSCHYCGETDWHLLGCDRINNDLPHTPDNVVPCCMNCNWERGTTDYNEFKK